MLVAGEWQPTRPEADGAGDPLSRGYHISGLYSPIGWLSWAEIARQWEAAAVDADARKTFVNTVLGEEWEEKTNAVPEPGALVRTPRSVGLWHCAATRAVLTAGADVQVDRIEVDVWAWGRGLESWLVEHLVLDGDPGRPEVWASMTGLLSRTWEHETGARLALQRLAIEPGSLHKVYQSTRSQDRATVLPVRGIGTYDRLVPVSGPTKVELLENGKRLRRGLNPGLSRSASSRRSFTSISAWPSRPTNSSPPASPFRPAMSISPTWFRTSGSSNSWPSSRSSSARAAALPPAPNGANCGRAMRRSIAALMPAPRSGWPAPTGGAMPAGMASSSSSGSSAAVQPGAAEAGDRHRTAGCGRRGSGDTTAADRRRYQAATACRASAGQVASKVDTPSGYRLMFRSCGKGIYRWLVAQSRH